MNEGVYDVLRGLLLLACNQDLEEVGGAFHWSRASQYNHALSRLNESLLKEHLFTVFNELVCALDGWDKKWGDPPSERQAIADGLRGGQRKDWA